MDRIRDGIQQTVKSFLKNVTVNFEQSDVMKRENQTKLNAVEQRIVDSYNAKSDKCKDFGKKIATQLET